MGENEQMNPEIEELGQGEQESELVSGEGLELASDEGQIYDEELELSGSEEQGLSDDEEEPYSVSEERELPFRKEEDTYSVTVGNETQTIEGRLEAVDTAKALSIEHDRRVVVERLDSRVLMHFSQGSLDSFVWETRPGK